MSQRIATISVYDALDQVVISVHVKEYDGLHFDGPSNVWQMGFAVQGEGIDEDAQWLSDALVALIEVL